MRRWPGAEKNWSRHAVANHGDRESTSSWAANRRWSLPTTIVTMALFSLGESPPIDGDVTGVVASFNASRILCLASSRNERFDAFLALPARSFVAANERLNMVSRDAIDLMFPTEERIVVISGERECGGWCWFDRDALLEAERTTLPSDLMICCSGDERKSTWRAGASLYTLRVPLLCLPLTCRAQPRRRPIRDGSLAYAREGPITMLHRAEATPVAIWGRRC